MPRRMVKSRAFRNNYRDSRTGIEYRKWDPTRPRNPNRNEQINSLPKIFLNVRIWVLIAVVFFWALSRMASAASEFPSQLMYSHGVYDGLKDRRILQVYSDVYYDQYETNMTQDSLNSKHEVSKCQINGSLAEEVEDDLISRGGREFNERQLVYSGYQVYYDLKDKPVQLFDKEIKANITKNSLKNILFGKLLETNKSYESGGVVAAMHHGGIKTSDDGLMNCAEKRVQHYGRIILMWKKQYGRIDEEDTKKIQKGENGKNFL